MLVCTEAAKGTLWGQHKLPCLMVVAEKVMAPHSSTLAWKIPWTEEPGGLQSMGSLRVGHNGATSLSLFTFTRWRRKWQPTPVFLPGESQGWGSLVGCRLWGHTELDITEMTQQQQQLWLWWWIPGLKHLSNPENQTPQRVNFTLNERIAGCVGHLQMEYKP